MAPPSLGTPRHTTLNRFEQDVPPPWSHPDVLWWYDEWLTIRDMCEGEKVVKEKGTRYMPQMSGMDEDEYEAFIERGTFYPFTGKTASAMSGSIFRRRAVMENLPERLEPALETITREAQHFDTLTMLTAEEVIKLGRFGVLLDLPAGSSTEPKPYLTGYTAENIIDWDENEVNGRTVLTRVVLREAKIAIDPKTTKKSYLPQYRVLSLDTDNVYRQRLYFSPDPLAPALVRDADLVDTITPMNRGKVINYIPFYIFGAMESGAKVNKPPMQDIARLNASHYRSYVQLEHGRFFAGFPIYYVEAPVGSSETEAEFTIGASRVWVTPSGAKPGILELNGQGLKFLVDALDIKEQQAAALGGRMMGVRTTAVAESDNMVKLSERNEQSVLLKIAKSLDVGFTVVLRWWLQFNDVPASEAAKFSIEFNKDFLFDEMGAREFRAVHTMYKDGVLPIDVVYHYLKKAMVIPDWMTLDELKSLLDKSESFPNNADVEARREGFADAKSRDQEDLLELEKELDADEAEEQRLHVEEQNDLDRVSEDRRSKEIAKAAAKQPKTGSPSGVKPGAKPKV